jgi:Uncharacterized distant relative of homeotic protein bithoraxoid
MALQGNIRDMSVADLIQHNCADRKKARLVLDHEGSTATVYFKDGEVIHAAEGNATGEEVIYQILGWEEGAFTLENDIEAPAVTIKRSWSGLLMEGAKRLDEQNLEFEPILTEPKEDWEAKSMAQKLEEMMQEMSTEMNGFVLGAIAGLDGMNIAQYTKGKMDADAITASVTVFLKLSSAANEKSGMGVMEDLLIQTDINYIMLVYLPGDPQHFLVAIVDRKSGSLGNMRLISKIYADRFSKIIPR